MQIKQDKEFISICIELVTNYTNCRIDKTDDVPFFNVYVVWYCKELQNFKALLSTSLTDGMYYEVTYNGNKNEIYLDAYKKFENKRIEL